MDGFEFGRGDFCAGQILRWEVAEGRLRVLWSIFGPPGLVIQVRSFGEHVLEMIF